MIARKVFISFSSKDTQYAEAFYLALSQIIAVENLFFAPTKIAVGEAYYERIMGFLAQADVLVVLASANSVGCQLANLAPSKHVAREIKEADDLNIPVFPIDIDGVLRRNTYDPSIRYFLGSAQYIDGSAARDFGHFDGVIEAIVGKLTNQESSAIDKWVARLQGHLANGQYADAHAMVEYVQMNSYPPYAQALIIAAKLSSIPRLRRALLQDVSTLENELLQILRMPASTDDDRALVLYMLGVLCVEFYQPNVIQCPAGSFEQLRSHAAALPRMSLASKKLVRGVSDDFRSFESRWFFGGA